MNQPCSNTLGLVARCILKAGHTGPHTDGNQQWNDSREYTGCICDIKNGQHHHECPMANDVDKFSHSVIAGEAIDAIARIHGIVRKENETNESISERVSQTMQCSFHYQGIRCILQLGHEGECLYKQNNQPTPTDREAVLAERAAHKATKERLI